MEECNVLGYCLGTFTGWDGDVEAIQFHGFKPDTQKITDWPTEATDLCIDLCYGKVQAYDANGEELKQWEWTDFIRDF